MSENKPTNGRDPGKVTGAILVLAGLVLFVLQLTTSVTISIMFLVGGFIFIAAYYNKHSYGLLIPGCILVGMGLGQLGDEYLDFLHSPSYIGLGLGFLGIYAVDKLHRGSTPWWPLVPGFILLLMGLETDRLNMGTLFSKGWPLVLVVVGALYLAGRLGPRRTGGRARRRHEPDGP
jgi:hypothetical protein